MMARAARSSTAERDEGASVGVAEREPAEVREREPHGVTPATQRGPPSGEQHDRRRRVKITARTSVFVAV